jgi:adenylate cyclase
LDRNIAIACGPVVAGVVGTRKFFYDVWVDAVNVVSRMESTDEAGKVRLSEAVCRQLEEEFELEPRGLIESKAKVKRPLGSWSGKKHCFLGPGRSSAARIRCPAGPERQI